MIAAPIIIALIVYFGFPSERIIAVNATLNIIKGNPNNIILVYCKETDKIVIVAPQSNSNFSKNKFPSKITSIPQKIKRKKLCKKM